MDCLHTRLDGEVFYRDVEFSFYDCKANERAKLAALLSFLVDTAGRDYEARGLPRSVLFANGCAFLLSRLSMRVHRTSLPYDVLTIQTWEHGIAGAFTRRAYALYDRSGALCVSASSAWLIIDPETRKLRRPASFTLRAFADEGPAPDCPPCAKITAPAQTPAPIGTREIRFSDLDGNGHLYSAQYAAIAVDCLPEAYQLRDVRDFSINYLKETLRGEILTLRGVIEQDSAYIEGICGDEPRFCCAMTFA